MSFLKLNTVSNRQKKGQKTSNTHHVIIYIPKDVKKSPNGEITYGINIASQNLQTKGFRTDRLQSEKEWDWNNDKNKEVIREILKNTEHATSGDPSKFHSTKTTKKRLKDIKALIMPTQELSPEKTHKKKQQIANA